MIYNWWRFTLYTGLPWQRPEIWLRTTFWAIRVGPVGVFYFKAD